MGSKPIPLIKRSTMQKCTICEKPIYGHPTVTKGALVCGSCTLSKVKGSPAGRTMFDVRLSLSKAMGAETLGTRAHRTTQMTSLKIKSNFARDRVIQLDDKHTLKFDHKGEASCPSHLRDSLDRLMAAKPNRFWIVDESKPVVVPVVKPVATDVPGEAATVIVEEVEELEIELPKQLDLSYLTEEKEEPVPQKKREPKKKKQSQD